MRVTPSPPMLKPHRMRKRPETHAPCSLLSWHEGSHAHVVDMPSIERRPLAVQMAFRWAGDANIAIAIELPAGGEHTRMVPKVTDLQVAGVARVILSPLVPVIPGFGAAVVALR